jgi:hypothetical protein
MITIKKIHWKSILKDMAWFYIFLLVFYRLAALLVWGHGFWMLESYKIEIDDMFDPSPTDFKKIEPESYISFLDKAGKYALILTCFAVFFRVPPKSFLHIAIVALVLALVEIPFFYAEIKEWIFSTAFLYGSILLAWLCSRICLEVKQYHSLAERR